jgi:hypothetical protein
VQGNTSAPGFCPCAPVPLCLGKYVEGTHFVWSCMEFVVALRLPLSCKCVALPLLCCCSASLVPSTRSEAQPCRLTALPAMRGSTAWLGQWVVLLALPSHLGTRLVLAARVFAYPQSRQPQEGCAPLVPPRPWVSRALLGPTKPAPGSCPAASCALQARD